VQSSSSQHRRLHKRAKKRNIPLDVARQLLHFSYLPPLFSAAGLPHCSMITPSSTELEIAHWVSCFRRVAWPAAGLAERQPNLTERGNCASPKGGSETLRFYRMATPAEILANVELVLSLSKEVAKYRGAVSNYTTWTRPFTPLTNRNEARYYCRREATCAHKLVGPTAKPNITIHPATSEKGVLT
jgi:hypothetical protein